MNVSITTKSRNQAFATDIIDWWNVYGREFPWRRTDDPFKVLIAEILLQRSRSGSVAKVITDLFQTWPSAKKLADANLPELENMISPLGLKSRASRLKVLARSWSELRTLPRNAQDLRNLPGVGPYSANATATAMLWDSGPCVDSVSIRVMRRFRGNHTKRQSDQRIASITYSGVPKDRWRELNWAILDLSAELCMPRVPRCLDCPLSEQCKWAQNHRQKPI